MRRAVWGLIVVLVASSVEARHAHAGFRVCNATPFLIDAAIGYKKNAQYGWVGEGWWHVSPGACRVLINQPLPKRHFYLYGMGTGAYSHVRYRGNTPFCIDQKKFVLYQSQYGANKQADCHAAGLRAVSFIDIDTRGKANWTQTLNYSGGAPAAGPPPPSSFTPQPAPPPPPPALGGGGSGSGGGSSSGTACQRYPNLC